MTRQHSLFYLTSFLFLTNIFIWYFSFAEEKSNVLTVSFLDVSQGDAIFIEAPNGNQFLIDAGGGRQILESLGKLLSVSDRTINVVLATHPDQDHIGGLPFVFDTYEVEKYVSNGTRAETAVFESLEGKIESEAVAHEVVTRGSVIDLGDGVIFEVFYPEFISTNISNRNDYSIVGKLSYGAHSFFLTGDAPTKTEQVLLSKYGILLDSDVLKLGHHGSRTSSGESFVRAVSPEYAIISAGCSNRYGHPHQEVVERVKTLAIKIFSTCEDGTITFKTDGITLWREY